MTKTTISRQITLEPEDNNRFANLCGPMDDNLRKIERRLGVEISYRGTLVKIVGNEAHCAATIDLLKNLYIETAIVKGKAGIVTAEAIHLAILDLNILEQGSEHESAFEGMVTINTKRGIIKPRNDNQSTYVQNILTNDISFGVGVAGTGKTYLAVACAVDALERQEVRRILLTRPAVKPVKS